MSNRINYHLIGIGGTGMSAIAQILHERGESVSGSDRQENDATRRLRTEGIRVSIGHAAENVDGADVVVYSAAIPADNPEMVEARAKGLTLLERPAMLGRIMEPYKHRIAISGTHGKTTTTSMLAYILDAAGLNASALIGGDVQAMGGNAHLGSGDIIITEACEAFGSFLHLYPSITVVTNIDADHLDFYGTIEKVEDSFRKFIGQLDKDGIFVACWDNDRVRKVAADCGRKVVKFGLCDECDVRAGSVNINVPKPTYTLICKGQELGTVELCVPGQQNVMDSLAAAAVARELNVDFDAIRSGLRNFHGAGRRFDILYDREIMVVDDYAHHPAEIRATLSAAKSAYNRRMVVVFQPHLYSRTQIFVNDFAEALAIADEVIVVPIYAAREKPIPGVSAESIVKKMKANGFANARYAPDKSTVARELGERALPGDMLLDIGAGDVRKVGEELADILSQRDA